MRNPTLYKIGMTNSCFGEKIMVKWLIYAIVHAFWVYYICFYSLNMFSFGWNSPIASDGQQLGLWIGGHAVFGTCIIVANLIVFHRHYIHQSYGIGLLSLMIGSYFVIALIMSRWSDPTTFADLSHLYSPLLGNPTVWFTMILACGGVSAGEFLLRHKQDKEQ
jgi:magnesium-transporting ATPase (P-type)